MEQSRQEIYRGISLFATVPAILWQALFLLVPLSIVGYFSFIDEATGRFTLGNYLTLFDIIYLRIVARSSLMSVSVAVTCFILAYPVAYFLALRVGRWKGPLLFLAMVPFWTNFLVQIYAWFFLLERNGVINTFLGKLGLGEVVTVNSLFAVFLVTVYCYLPFMLVSLYIVMERIDRRLLEASHDLGATPWQTLSRITLPLSLPGVRVGTLLVLIPVFGEFAIPSLMGGSHYMFVGSLISYYSLVVQNKGLAAAFTGLSGLVLLLIVVLFQRAFRLIRPDEMRGA